MLACRLDDMQGIALMICHNKLWIIYKAGPRLVGTGVPDGPLKNTSHSETSSHSDFIHPVDFIRPRRTSLQGPFRERAGTVGDWVRMRVATHKVEPRGVGQMVW